MTLKTINNIAVANVKTWNGIVANNVKTVNTETWIHSAGQLWVWGRNETGQLGLGNTTNYSSPKQVGTLTTWSSISGGGANAVKHVLAVKSDGTLWAWGSNSSGQLGLGNTTVYSSPKQVGAETTWSVASAGGAHSAAIKTNGTLWTWGAGLGGALGFGNTTNYSSPKQVGALTTWSKITASRISNPASTFGITTSGALWVWGSGNYGNLGLGNETNYSSPKQVGALTTWSTCSPSSQNTLATTTGGALFGWGRNTYGMLGLGNTTAYSSPKQVGALTTWVIISEAPPTSHALATKTDGTLWAWGRSNSGQLGLGNTTDYSSPKQVGALTTWSKITAGSNFSAATTTGGTSFTWGFNYYGQLGLGNTTDYSSPKQVGALTDWVGVANARFSVLAVK